LTWRAEPASALSEIDPPVLVPDRFIGSGTTGLVPLKLNRRFVGARLARPLKAT
jgi:hypothetical protein